MPTLFNMDQNETVYVDLSNFKYGETITLTDMYSESSRDTGYGMSNHSNMSPMSTYSDGSAQMTVPNLQCLDITPNEPYLSIIEQPIDKFRFRYKSEMHGTHGSLTAVSNSRSKKCFPTVRLNNFNHEALVRCSMYQTNVERMCLHSHSLVVRRDNDDCKDPHAVVMSMQDGYTAIFQGMGIIHTAKKFIVDELHEKLLERNRFLSGRDATDLEKAKLRVTAEQESKSMNLNSVCLCFEAFQKQNGKYVSICKPILSNPINNMKSALTGELKITRLSVLVSDVVGNIDLFLFVEKVGKKNIKVRFYEVDENEEVVWEDFGRFSEADVHHQYAIALRTPPYKDKDVDHCVDVFIQLYRPSDGCESAPVQFRYKPRSAMVARKRARLSSTFSSAELPATVVDEINQMSSVPNTISKEFNKSELIDDCLMNQSFNSFNFQSNEMENFLKIVQNNSDEFIKLFDSKELMGPVRTQADCGGKGLVVDGATSHRSGMLSEQLKSLPNIIQKMTANRSKEASGQFIRQLFATENQKGRDILHMLISEDHDITVSRMLQLIKQNDLKDLLELRNEHDETVLHMACTCDKPEHIKTLLAMGADPNVADVKGNTPLHVAVAENLARCVGALIDNQSSKHKLLLDMANDEGMTALHLSIRNDHIINVKRLINAGASTKVAESKQGNNALHFAVQESSVELVKYLLSSTNADANLPNGSDQTPLQLALCAEPVVNKIVEMLLETTSTDNVVELMPQHYVSQSIKIKEEEEEDVQQRSDTPVSQRDTTIESHLTHQTHSSELDDICLTELCEIFNKSDRWKRLAEALNYDAFTSVWEASKNPSRMLFKFSEVQGTKLHHLVKVFRDMGASDAFGKVDEMIARRFEADED